MEYSIYLGILCGGGGGVVEVLEAKEVLLNQLQVVEHKVQQRLALGSFL